MFRGDIRKIIKQSDLFYLSPERRRTQLAESTSLKVEEVNIQISLIFEGYNLQEDGNQGLIGYKQLIIISNLCSSYKKFLGLIFNSRENIFLNIDAAILRQIIKICTSKEDFIKICSHEKITYMVAQKQEWNLFYVLRIVNNISELFELFENTDFIYFITKSNSNNLEFILDFLNINTINQIKELLEDGKWGHIKKLLKNGTTDNIKDVLILSEENSLTISSGIVDFNKIWIVGTCRDSDMFNQQLLEFAQNGDRCFTPIFWEDMVIAYLKMGKYGEKSVTGVRDVFDEDGVLIFKKGMIYAPEHTHIEYLGTHYLPDKKGFELSTLGAKLSINPIRMLHIEYLDWLIKSFKTRNGFK